jgi:DNA polymerase I-like protein with 3'-5' exonuclease and polymerase domains
VSDHVVIDIETTGNLPWEHELVSVGIGLNVHPPDKGRGLARMLMSRPGTTIVAHTNYDLRWLMLDGARLGPDVHYHDTKVMAWLLDATQELDLESLAVRYLGYVPPKLIKKVQGRIMFQSSVGLVPIEEAPWDELSAYNRSDLHAEADLYEALRAELRSSGQWRHFLTEEAPFSRLLVEMEVAGMPFDKAAAEAMQAETLEDMNRRERWLVELTSAPNFNLRSGDQVASFLYTDYWTQDVRFEIPRLNGKSPEEKREAVEAIAPERVHVTKIGRDYAYGEMALDGLGLKPPKRGKKQKTARPSVSGKTLAVLYGENPWISEYVAWRKLDKLSGYLRDWIAREHEGRLYGRFDQSGTVTGRLSAREPNLQQVATEGTVRGLFRGDLVVGDYGGLEVRISAHFSGDPTMSGIFHDGGDLYGTLAANAWGGPADKSNEGRGLMKVLMLACPAPDVRLLTRDLRWVAAGDLRPGDQLWTVDEHLNDEQTTGRGRARRYRPGEVVRSFLTIKERVRVNLETGESVICSDDHPWLAARKNGKFKQRWVRARDLTDEWSVRRCFSPWSAEDTREAGWLAGFLDGEGNIGGGKCRRGGVSATQVVGPTADRMVEALKRYGTVSVDRQHRAPHQERITARLLHGLGPANTAEFLGRVRPERLIRNFDLTGGVAFGNLVKVVSVEPLGPGEIQSIETTTHTYIGEGFPMHNTQYGAGPEQISVLLAIAGMKGYTPQKAGLLLKDLERTLPRLFEWRQEVIWEAERNGYVTTLAGRRRHLAGLRSAGWEKRGKAERQAVNSKVQGSAADIVRRAMLRARAEVNPEKAIIVLQVHDEILWERGPAWDASVFSTLVDICQNGHGFELDVPLVFEAQVAESWADKSGDAGQVQAGAYAHLQEVAT